MLQTVVFNYLIGNTDAHGKNYSLLYPRKSHPGGKPSLAPLYDLICTVKYPGLQKQMAMKIGREYDPRRIYPRHFDHMAEDAGLTKRLVRRMVTRLTEDVLAALPTMLADYPAAEEVAANIEHICRRTIRVFQEPEEATVSEETVDGAENAAIE